MMLSIEDLKYVLENIKLCILEKFEKIAKKIKNCPLLELI